MNNRIFYSLLEEKNFMEAEKYRRSCIPNKLIKFVALDGDGEFSDNDRMKFKSLCNQQIWVSKVSSFNDPFEFKTLYAGVEKLKDNGFSDEKIKQVKSVFDSAFNPDYLGISCLSANSSDFLPMWAYYTNNYKGFCIEYEVLDKDYLYEVLYEPKRIPVANILVTVINEISKKLDNEEYDQDTLLKYMITLKMNLAIKSDNWKHEKEVRIIYGLENEKGQNVDIAKIGLKVSRVICGINIHQNDKKALNKISNRIGCGNAFESHTSETTYGLIETRIK